MLQLPRLPSPTSRVAAACWLLLAAGLLTGLGCTDAAPGSITPTPDADVPTDAAAEVAVDTGLDAPADLAPDTPGVDQETSTDTEPDLPDTAPDVAPDGPPDIIADDGPDVADTTDASDASEVADGGDATDASDLDDDGGPTLFEPTGLWLVGWGGGLDHFDWMRFEAFDPVTTSGVLRWANPEPVGSLVPWTSCSGVTEWTYANQPGAIQILLPPGCDEPQFPQATASNGFIVLLFTVQPAPPWPEQAIGTATVSMMGGDQFLTAYAYPDDFCSPDLSSCPDPFAAAP